MGWTGSAPMRPSGHHAGVGAGVDDRSRPGPADHSRPVGSGRAWPGGDRADAGLAARRAGGGARKKRTWPYNHQGQGGPVGRPHVAAWAETDVHGLPAPNRRPVPKTPRTRRRLPGCQDSCYQESWRTKIIYTAGISSPCYSRNRVRGLGRLVGASSILAERAGAVAASSLAL